MKRMASSKLYTSVLESHMDKFTQTNMERTQSTCWLSDLEQVFLTKIATRLDLVTGLNVAKTDPASILDPYSTFESEMFQVGVYGPGGLYYPHLDAFNKFDSQGKLTSGDHWVGNRLATAMIYLSDGIIGGGTAFPKL